MTKFQNLPMEVSTSKGTTSVNVKTKQEPKKRKHEEGVKRNIMWEGVKILCVLLVLGFVGVKAYDVGRKSVGAWQELRFSYSHPELVKPIRALYEGGHSKTDEDLRQILNVGK